MTDHHPETAAGGRIFVVGVPRSGTTLLQSLLAAHPQVTSFTESHLFSRPFRRVPGLGPVLVEDPTPRLLEFLAENGASVHDVAPWFAPPVRPELGSRIGLASHTRKVARRLVDVLDALGRLRGMPVWLEKTPRHLQAIDLLESVCNDGVPTHFVHLFRDGLQTVASLFAASRDWPVAYNLDTCIDRWNRDLQRSVRCLDRPGHVFVCYEALTRDPEAVLRPLFTVLDLPWAASVLSDFGDVTGKLVASGERWKGDVGRSIQPSATAGEVLDGTQRERVLRRLRGDAYEKLRSRALEEPWGE
ncbi:MAG: sulfotransferase [Xanthomonadales bacterium]|nr:sulfotransferase [Xanthomonadales bacterium]